MRRPSALLFVLLATVARGQGAKDDDLSSAFGPPEAAKKFEPERNVPAPPLPEDPNAELRPGFEKDLAAAQKAFDGGNAAAAREQLVLLEAPALALGGPERVRVHRLQRAVAAKLDDRAALKDADGKWLTACGPTDVSACRTAALEAIAGYDKPRVEKTRAADACLAAAEKAPGKANPACLDAALALYQKADDTLMVARVELLRALAGDARSGKAGRKALERLATSTDDRSATVRRTALETLSRLELTEGAVDAAVNHGILASGAWASTLPPGRRAWARSPVLDAACAAYDKAKTAGACHALEKKLLGDYVFHDFSDEKLGEQLLGHDKLVAVNEHYGVLIQNCLAAEVRRIQGAAAITYRVRWLVLENGHVDNFHSDSSAQAQSQFVKCLRQQFGYWRYPSHEGDPQVIEQGFTVKSTTRTFEEAEE